MSTYASTRTQSHPCHPHHPADHKPEICPPSRSPRPPRLSARAPVQATGLPPRQSDLGTVACPLPGPPAKLRPDIGASGRWYPLLKGWGRRCYAAVPLSRRTFGLPEHLTPAQIGYLDCLGMEITRGGLWSETVSDGAVILLLS